MADYVGEFFPVDNASLANSLYTPSVDLSSSGFGSAAPASDVWSGINASYFSPSDNTVNSTPSVSGAGVQTVTAQQVGSDAKGIFNTGLDAFKSVIGMKTDLAKLSLQNDQIGLQKQVTQAGLQNQAAMMQAQMQISRDAVEKQQITADTQLGIARLQAPATLAAVQANPLSSQFLTGQGLMGNLSADGKMSLLIGIATIWLMLRHKGA